MNQSLIRWHIYVVSMMNVGVQCCKRNGVSVAIGAREKIRVDPFGSMHLFPGFHDRVSSL